jgi:cytosine/uracil/thiamine/allantoin permease
MALAMILSIWLFSNQVQFVGIVPTAIPEFGDVAFEFGFIFAIVFYAILFKFQRERRDEKMVLPTP